MARFSAWVKKHLSLKPRAQRLSEPQLPYLNTQRRSITPTSFEAQICLFFQLPYDIREMIILMALGNRTLHMDLMYQNEAWKWSGNVCGRCYSWARSTRYDCGLWVDSCMQQDASFSRRRNPGVMGFLLSCKQGYTEGIHVLYSTNCINIASRPLLMNLPRLIPANRLGAITSLEVTVFADRIEEGNGRPSFSLQHLEPILENIKTHCHQLRSFYLSILVRSRYDHILDGPTLPSLDAFYRFMSLRVMRVELPCVTYYEQSAEWEVKHPCEAAVMSAIQKFKWRALNSEEPRVQHRPNDRYPFPPLKMPLLDNEGDGTENRGYWLLRGDEGPQSLVCNMPG